MSLNNPLIPKEIKENYPKSVTFNREKVKNQMKTMIRKSESLHNKQNINEFDTTRKSMMVKHSEFQKRNIFEKQNKHIEELDNIKQSNERLHAQLNSAFNILNDENKDTNQLIEFYKKQIAQQRSIYDKICEEEKIEYYREEMEIEAAKKELEGNLVQITYLKSECLGLESELTSKERSEEIDHKIEYATIELEDKIKYKQFKQNESMKKDEEYDEQKLRLSDLNRINMEYIEDLRFLHNTLQESKGNIRVFCRVRPIIGKEFSENNPNNYIEFPNHNSIILSGPIQKSNVGKSKDVQYKEIYKFDRVFKPEDSQSDVFKEITQLVQSALDGYKVCIFAYGQTGSGKTYTMEGEEDELRGLIPRSIEQIFEVKSQLEYMGWKFTIEVSSVEIYIDQVRDLLMNSNNNVISSNNNKIEKFTTIEVNKVEDVYPLIDLAKQKRKVAETMCNEKSSRSHSLFQLKITGKNIGLKQERHGALNLIDLAGSERISKSKVEDERLRETISINKSLVALKSVFTALINTNVKNTHIPYRDSILTYLLQNYLGGDSKTLMFVNISPLFSNFSESSYSLKFASDVNSCYLKQDDK